MTGGLAMADKMRKSERRRRRRERNTIAPLGVVFRNGKPVYSTPPGCDSVFGWFNCPVPVCDCQVQWAAANGYPAHYPEGTTMTTDADIQNELAAAVVAGDRDRYYDALAQAGQSKRYDKGMLDGYSYCEWYVRQYGASDWRAWLEPRSTPLVDADPYAAGHRQGIANWLAEQEHAGA